MNTGRENVHNNRVAYDVINRDKTEYSSHALAEDMDGEHNNDWISVIRYRIGR